MQLALVREEHYFRVWRGASTNDVDDGSVVAARYKMEIIHSNIVPRTPLNIWIIPSQANFGYGIKLEYYHFRFMSGELAFSSRTASNVYDVDLFSWFYPHVSQVLHWRQTDGACVNARCTNETVLAVERFATGFIASFDPIRGWLAVRSSRNRCDISHFKGKLYSMRGFKLIISNRSKPELIL